MEIITYNNNRHRAEVTALWQLIFSYKEARNAPEFIIDQKISVNDGLFFVANENGRVIGTIMAGYDGHRGWIYALAVLPDERKMRVGSQLLDYAEEKLKSLGCSKINLQILSSNESVKQFYMKNGYIIEERISMGKVIEENAL